MSNIFSTVEVLKFPRSRFRFRKTRRASYGYGKIYPCFIRNMTPGETTRVSLQSMLKAQPMSAPSMTPQRMDYHFFFVPYRILDELFCIGYTGIVDTDRTIDGVSYKRDEEFDYQFPIWSPTDDELKVGTMWDYFGFGINVKDVLSITPVTPPPEDPNEPYYLGTNPKGVEPSDYVKRAYNLIYNTMFRDENLIDEVDLESSILRYRSYRPDYFTKALPFQQLPSDVTFALPFQISTSINSSNDYFLGNFAYGNQTTFPMIDSDTGKVVESQVRPMHFVSNSSYGPKGKIEDSKLTGVSPSPDIGLNGVTIGGLQNGYTSPNQIDVRPAIRGSTISDGLSATSVISQALTVGETRNAFQLLKEAERSARTGGHRFDEYIKAHWGEFPGDARLQLPEFIGGFKVPILVGDSIQTSETTSSSSQGNRVGIGNGIGGNSTHWYHCQEPGILMGLCSILPRSEYMQGVPRMWQLHDRLDFPRHEFCCLSEVQVKTGELVLSNSSTDSVAKKCNEAPFGYQGIYNEYRCGTDETVGQMRTLYQYWHQTRIFDPNPDSDNEPSTKLNQDFVEAKDVSLRTYLNNDKKYDPFTAEEIFEVDTVMPITKRAVPGLTDHF